MRCVNLGAMPNKLFAFVMNIPVVINVNTTVELFEMDGSAPFKLAKDFDDFSRDEAIKVLFLENPPNVVLGKILTTRLSIEDRVLHYNMVKCILPRKSNVTNIIEEELFLMWPFERRLQLNFPYIILSYMGSFYTKP